MSLHLNFEPHSWYKGFAIKDNRAIVRWLEDTEQGSDDRWSAYTDNGNTYQVNALHADTPRELKQQIKEWHKAEAERDAYNRARLLKTEEG